MKKYIRPSLTLLEVQEEVVTASNNYIVDEFDDLEELATEFN